MPRETNNPRPPPPPRRPQMGSGADPADRGVLRCTCFHLRSRSKKKQPPPALAPPVTTKLLSSASRRSTLVPNAPAPFQSQRITFLVSASLATWWPSSPSAASAGPAPAPGGGSVVAPRRASTSSSSAPRNAGAPRASSSSFSYWRRSLSSRVMPHGAAAARVSFSFPTSPASASSSCMSTPKIPHGCPQ